LEECGVLGLRMGLLRPATVTSAPIFFLVPTTQVLGQENQASVATVGLHEKGASILSSQIGQEIDQAKSDPPETFQNLAKPFIGPRGSPGIWSTSVSRQRPSASPMRHGYRPVSTQPQMIQQDAISVFLQKVSFCRISSHSEELDPPFSSENEGQ